MSQRREISAWIRNREVSSAQPRHLQVSEAMPPWNPLFFCVFRASDSLAKKWTCDLPMNRIWSGRRGFEADLNRFALIPQVQRTQPCDDLH